MNKFPTDDVLENLYIRIRESDQLQTVLQFFEMKYVDARLSEVANYGEEDHRAEDQDTELSGQKREERNRSSVKESMGAKRWRKRSGRMPSMESTRTVLKTTQL